MKTPLQQLIEFMEIRYHNSDKEDFDTALIVCIEKAKSLLQEERDMVIDAFAEGHARFTECGEFELDEKAENYFNQTYNNIP